MKKDYNFFLGRIYFTSNDGSQNTFIYQPTLDAIELKKDKSTDYVLSWKSNGVYNSKLKPIYTAFWHSTIVSGYKMGMKFEKDPLAVEQNNYLTKTLNVYIVYDLVAWPRNPTNNFKFKNFLFGAINKVKNSDKEKHVYSVYGVTFDSAGSWGFGNDFARNVIVFGVDNNSSSHSDNRKNNFLILGECPTYGINGSFGVPEKKFSINFTKQAQNFVWVYSYWVYVFKLSLRLLIIVISLLMEKKYLHLKPTIKMLTFQLNFVLEVCLMDSVLISLEKYF